MTQKPDPLGLQKKGFRGIIVGFHTNGSHANESNIDRLRDIGFAEGLSVEILHQNPFGTDPIAVQVGSMTVAVRRKDAELILVDTHG